MPKIPALVLVFVVFLSMAFPSTHGTLAQGAAPTEQMRRAQELVLQKRYLSARQAFSDLLGTAQTSGDLAIKAYTYYGRGYCELEPWEFTKVRDDLERSFQLYKELGSPHYQARVKFQLGRLKENFNLSRGPRSHYLPCIGYIAQKAASSY